LESLEGLWSYFLGMPAKDFPSDRKSDSKEKEIFCERMAERYAAPPGRR